MRKNISRQVMGRFMQLVKLFGKLLGSLFLFLMVALIVKSSLKHFSPYISPSIFLEQKQPYAPFYLPALYGHIITSGPILFLGFLGFSSWIRKNNISLHRVLGKIYVLLILLISAPCGFLMAWSAQGGWVGKSCFLILSSLWWYFTWKAWTAVRKKDISKHQAFMLRSYALTLSAVCLRWYTFIFFYYWNLRGEIIYPWIAWGSWVPNLVLVELYLWKRQ